MAKETEKTLGWLLLFLSLVAFQLGGRTSWPPPSPLGYAYDEVGS